MVSKHPEDGQEDGPIELEPLPEEVSAQWKPEPGRAGRVGGRIEPQTVPAKPLHLCPNCDYNLTGLTSRRCPECGEPFLLTEARLHAIEQSAVLRAERQSIWTRRFLGVLGLVLLAVGFSLPWISFGGGQTWPSFAFTRRGWDMWLIAMPLLCVALMIRAYQGTNWSHFAFSLGLIVLILGLLFRIIW